MKIGGEGDHSCPQNGVFVHNVVLISIVKTDGIFCYKRFYKNL